MPAELFFDVVIVGAGHGGAQVAVGLRQRGYEGSIAIIGAETDPPYERPPLSKEFLLGEKSFERILIRPPAFWTERNVTIRTGERVVKVDPAERAVSCESGARLGYGTLVWAGGGEARRLSCAGSELAGVHSVRTHHDVRRLKSALATATRVCVIGGGYIGLESAAVLRKLGKHVTIVESQQRLLARVSGAALSQFLETEHRNQGVDVRLSESVSAIEGSAGAVRRVRLASGDAIDCNIAIVGIGIVPSTAPLLAAGARGSDGVDVDPFCRTSLENIFAVGDCARHSNTFADGQPIRLESVQNANDMASTVSKMLTGMPSPYEAVPWFWSNQYDLRLQTMGLSLAHDQEVVRGDPRSRSFSVVYLKDGRVRALDCINATKDYVGGRSLVVSRAVISPERLADATVPLKDMQAAT